MESEGFLLFGKEKSQKLNLNNLKSKRPLAGRENEGLPDRQTRGKSAASRSRASERRARGGGGRNRSAADAYAWRDVSELLIDPTYVFFRESNSFLPTLPVTV